ncbi:MAG: histone deacetylase family protein [Desulforhabdus sp.]|jgi:acetoin utilization deacetylase AcuC-like enzyme|nr:histone deacetylase family protein [Desulforhabdus sp.]
MFRIRRIFDDILPANREAIRQAQQILADQFPLLNPTDIDKVPELLRNPLKHQFQSILYIAEGFKRSVKGFALLSYEPNLHFCFLDYISTFKPITGSGIGGALYARIREEALALNSIGIFLECLPDDPKLCKDPATLRTNKARLRFYESFGALPIINTAYETPVRPGDDNPPYLVFDDLGLKRPLQKQEAVGIVRAILERKYRHLCPRKYVEMVAASFRDDPVLVRQPRYTRKETFSSVSVIGKFRKIALIVTDRHAIHHVHERGYVESPVRIKSILKELEKLNIFERITPREFSEKHLKAVHGSDYIEYFKRVCKTLPLGKSVYPYVFPIRNSARPPKELAVRAGYYCIDTFTPLNANAFQAAKRAVDCALTGAEGLLEGYLLAYALVRPPGHHAERRSFGGFCYFNNAGAAAQFLAQYGKIAVLDIDYHHGNGQQQIFYERSDILTISIHGHPHFAYPYFSGFEDESGDGPGKGYNINYPLPEKVSGEVHLASLEKALKKIGAFAPAYLIVALGLDTAKGDPTGTWNLIASDYDTLGKAIGRMKVPTLVIQEGGYNNRVIGVNARHFFAGLWSGRFDHTQIVKINSKKSLH